MRKSDYPWAPDALADYWSASDDIRRQMILKNGYDPSLRSEIERLFPPPSEKEKPPKDWSKIDVFVSIGTCIAGIVAAVLIARFI